MVPMLDPWVRLRGLGGLLAIVFVNCVVMFCAAVKTDEKKPPPPGEPWLPDKRPLDDLDSSGIGVKGAEMALDSLLGACVTESDRTLRCDIRLPEEEAAVFGLVPPALKGLLLRDGLVDGDILPRMGVGGVTVVLGVEGRPAL